MPTGNYAASLNIRLWVKPGTTASNAPTSTTGMTEVLSLSDASIQGSSQILTPTDYQTPFGATRKLVSGIDQTIPLQLNLDTTSVGYAMLKHAYNNAASGQTLQFYRQLMLIGNSNTDPQVDAGVAFVADFRETLARGGISAVSFVLNCDGEVYSYQQGDGIATLTVTNPGSGLSAGTGIALIPVSPTAGNMSGFGGTATITVNGSGVIQTATIVDAGRNFRVGDTLTISDPAVVGVGDTAPLFTVATVS